MRLSWAEGQGTVAVNVLLIDNEDDARATLAGRLLRLRSVKLVGAVRDEREAGNALSHAEPDVLLVDLHSRHGESDGVRLCSELRKLAVEPLLVLTSFITGEQWQRLQAAGVTNYLLKRVDSGHLERELVLMGTRHRNSPAVPEERMENAQ